MQIQITGRHVDVTENIRTHIEEKIERSLSTVPRVESIHVILDVEKRLYMAEVLVQAANHVRISSTEKSENMYASIDTAIEHAERQLRKVRDKIVDHHK